MQSVGIMDAEYRDNHSVGGDQPGYVVNEAWNHAMNAVFGSQSQQSSGPGHKMTHRSGSDVLMVDGKVVAASAPQVVMEWEYQRAMQRSKPELLRSFEKWKAEHPNRPRNYHGEPNYFAPDQKFGEIDYRAYLPEAVRNLRAVDMPENVNDFLALFGGGLTGYYHTPEKRFSEYAPFMVASNPMILFAAAPSWASQLLTGRTISQNIGRAAFLDSGFVQNRDAFRTAQPYGELFAEGTILAATFRGLRAPQMSVPKGLTNEFVLFNTGAGAVTSGFIEARNNPNATPMSIPGASTFGAATSYMTGVAAKNMRRSPSRSALLNFSVSFPANLAYTGYEVGF